MTFPPVEALRIARKFEMVHTPRHGSWLNVAKIELSVLAQQCVCGHLAEQACVEAPAHAWACQRNAKQTGVKWHFTTDDARTKLHSLYPKVIE